MKTKGFRVSGTCFEGSETCFGGSETCFEGSETCFEGSETCFEGSETGFEGSETGFEGSRTGFETSKGSDLVSTCLSSKLVGFICRLGGLGRLPEIFGDLSLLLLLGDSAFSDKPFLGLFTGKNKFNKYLKIKLLENLCSYSHNKDKELLI